MDVNLFEYKMKEAGYKTPEQRADALGISLSAYYRRINQACECSKAEMEKVAEIVGWDAMKAIFFG